MTESIDYVQALRRDWARVGTTERGRIGRCGICGCKSDLWTTVGSTMLGIKTILVCPGYKQDPELHEKISKKQDLLRDGAVPASAQEEIILEIREMRALISRAELKSDAT